MVNTQVAGEATHTDEDTDKREVSGRRGRDIRMLKTVDIDVGS